MTVSEELQEKYNVNRPLYERLESSVRDAIETVLEQESIAYLAVTGRVKEFSSFQEKVESKNYEKPFEENEDFVGIRIISYFIEDVDNICELIDRNFDVIATDDKSSHFAENEFGYRSIHKVICLPKSWCNVPKYKGLDGIKCELQIRTILMHAWAEVEHKLKYKNKASVPKVISRKFTTISGLFENIDIQFQEMREQVNAYVSESSEILNDPESNEPVEINYETLTLYLTENYTKLVGLPIKTSTHDNYSKLAQQLVRAGYTTISELNSDLEKTVKAFKKMADYKRFHDVGWVRVSLRNIGKIP